MACNDSLADANSCTRDIPYSELLINFVRVYAIDTGKDHKACMLALQDAGIYVISDPTTSSTSLNIDNPGWDTTIYSA